MFRGQFLNTSVGVMLSEVGTGRFFTDDFAPIDSIYGSGSLPHKWNPPKIFDPNASLAVDLRLESGGEGLTPIDFKLVHSGFKIYGNIDAYEVKQHTRNLGAYQVFNEIAARLGRPVEEIQSEYWLEPGSYLIDFASYQAFPADSRIREDFTVQADSGFALCYTSYIGQLQGAG